MMTYNLPKSFFNDFKESTRLIKPDSLNRILKENMMFKMPSSLEKADAPVLVMVGRKTIRS